MPWCWFGDGGLAGEFVEDLGGCGLFFGEDDRAVIWLVCVVGRLGNWIAEAKGFEGFFGGELGMGADVVFD